MKPHQETIDLCNQLFARAPAVVRVDGEIRPGNDENVEIDLAILVDGDLYASERQVLPLIVELMSRHPSWPVEFVVLPATARPEAAGEVIYMRE
jgi:hypothetical protein